MPISERRCGPRGPLNFTSSSVGSRRCLYPQSLWYMAESFYFLMQFFSSFLKTKVFFCKPVSYNLPNSLLRDVVRADGTTNPWDLRGLS